MNTPLPGEFIERLRRDYPHRAPELLSSLDEEPTVSIRWNAKKIPNPSKLASIPWSEHGFYLSNRSNFAADPWWHAGVYYVQEPSSRFLEHAVKTIKSELPEYAAVLDLSAAPGGKTLALDQSLPDKAVIIANEIVPKRAQILRENMLRWGSRRIAVTNNTPKSIGTQKDVLDLIIVDAPCSGEGMFRKDETARMEWTPNSGVKCSARQTEILNDIWPALNPGGFLIFSTCPFDAIENLDSWAHLDVAIIPLEMPTNWGIERVEKEGRFGYQWLPDRVRGEGFFLTVLHKRGTSERHELHFDLGPPHVEVPWIVGHDPQPWDHETGYISTQVYKDRMFLSLSNWDRTHIRMKELNLVLEGIPIAEKKGNEWRPTTFAVWCEEYWPHFPPVDLELEDVLNYLHGGDVRGDFEEPGFVVLRYRGIHLGIGKQLRGRINNGYPKPFRLRKHPSSLEDTIPPW